MAPRCWPSPARTARGVTEIRPALAAGAIAVQHATDYESTAVVIVEESLIEPPRWSELDLATGGGGS